jgi:ferric iron reductase protein FhuF
MKNKQLLSNEIDILVERYRLTLFKNEHPLSFPCSELLNQVFVNDLLNRLNRMYQSTENFVIASQFIKRYSFMVAVPFLYGLSMFDKEIDIDLQRTSLQSYDEGGAWLPKLNLTTFEVTTPDGKGRKEWRLDAFERLFKEHLSPIIKMLAQQGKVSRQILWENTAVYIFWIYESMMEQEPSNPLILEDFTALLEAEGALFGDYTYNPIGKFYMEKRYVAHKEKKMRVRKTCCFYNRLSGVQSSCTTCPLACNVVQKKGEEILWMKS